MVEEIINNKIVIPLKLQSKDLRFIKVRERDKSPIELSWPTKNNYEHNNATLLEYIAHRGNYGVCGGFGNLIIIDSDTQEVTDFIEQNLPKTFTVLSASNVAYKKHFYYRCEDCKSRVLISFK